MMTEHTHANDIWIQLWNIFQIFTPVDGWFTVAVHYRVIKT